MCLYDFKEFIEEIPEFLLEDKGYRYFFFSSVWNFLSKHRIRFFQINYTKNH